MIRVFEAFAGYGSQRMALRNIGIEFEVVGISEIEGDVIQSYAMLRFIVIFWKKGNILIAMCLKTKKK